MYPGPLFDTPGFARVNPSEFLDDIYPAKTTGIGPYGENFIILINSTGFDWSTGVTDERTARRTGDSM